MIEVGTPLEVLPKQKFKYSDLIFVHQSSEKFNVIKPQTYDAVAKQRDSNKYMRDRKKTERKYHELLGKNIGNMSFMYASLASRSHMHSVNELIGYPGYVYYFRLNPSQIERCVFECIGGKDFVPKTRVGKTGLIKAMQEWDINSSEFKEYHDEIVGGIIYPRIEVVVPFSVKPFAYIPQVEDRVFYHGSRTKFTELRKNSYVTPYSRDALVFAVPWSSNDLVYAESLSEIEGRPPEYISLKKGHEIEDMPLYLYRVQGVMTSDALTNTGRDYAWNRTIDEEASEANGTLELIRTIPSWKKELSF